MQILYYFSNIDNENEHLRTNTEHEKGYYTGLSIVESTIPSITWRALITATQYIKHNSPPPRPK